MCANLNWSFSVTAGDLVAFVCRECILKTAKTLVEDTKLLVSGAGASQEKLAQAAQSSVSTITKLADVVKLGAASLGSEDPETQVWKAEVMAENMLHVSQLVSIYPFLKLIYWQKAVKRQSVDFRLTFYSTSNLSYNTTFNQVLAAVKVQNLAAWLSTNTYYPCSSLSLLVTTRFCLIEILSKPQYVKCNIWIARICHFLIKIKCVTINVMMRPFSAAGMSWPTCLVLQM